MTDQPAPDPLAQESIVAAAAAEQRAVPASDAEAADRADRYERMMRLAALFDDSGEQLRERARLGEEVVRDPAFAESAPLSPATHQQAEDDVRAATTGKRGLLSRSIELDADALVLRATVLTYRWIDELQSAAQRTLGSIAARAIGYLAPEVALGGAIVSAGLIETDTLDRDGVAAYLGELADANPELLDHVTSGGGGLLDGLRMRSLLTAGVPALDDAPRAAAGGLRAAGVEPFPTTFAAALRDTASGYVQEPAAPPATDADLGGTGTPRGLAELMAQLEEAPAPVVVRRVGGGRYIAYLSAPGARAGRHLRLVDGDRSGHVGHVVRAIEAAVEGDPGARVMLVGAGQGGVVAAEVAASLGGDGGAGFVVDQVVTAGAPSAHVPRIPEATRVLSIEDRTDPVALLGSLINAGVTNRVTVVFDGGRSDGASLPVAGGRAADEAAHPDLQAEIRRIQELGYLAG